MPKGPCGRAVVALILTDTGAVPEEISTAIVPKVSLLPSAEHRLPGAAPGSKTPAGQGDELFEVDLIAFGWRATR